MNTTASYQPPRSVDATGHLDVRPILERNESNAWESTERARIRLYELIEGACADRGVQALVLQSEPYVHPAWVKFESWLPAGPAGTTARASAIVKLTTKPFHKFETLYEVEWEKHGHKGTFDQLYRMEIAEIEKLLVFLGAPPMRSFVRREVKRLLSSSQLRQRWHQYWRPKNNIPAVRRDRFLIGSILVALLGGALVLFSPAVEELVYNYSSTYDDFYFEPAEWEFEEAPLFNDLLPEESVVNSFGRQPIFDSGSLNTADPLLDDGRYFDTVTVAAATGDTISVTMESTEFDTLIILSEVRNGEFAILASDDDGAGDGSNSHLVFSVETGGEYTVILTSYEAGESGSYFFSIE